MTSGDRATAPAWAGRTYTNPVGYVDGVVRTNPDPFVLRFRGRYWCYSSDEAGVNVSVSSDLVVWRSLGHALVVEGRRHYWAPCVIHVDGTFWMYFSNRPAGSDDPHEEILQVATSARPEGPFTVRRAFFDTFSIDPHVIRDPRTGEYVMFYSANNVTGLTSKNAGTSILVDRMVAMDQLLGQARPVVVPTLDEEIFERDRFGDGRDWYTIEGATYFSHHDTAFLTYSGNAYTGENYFIGYSRDALSGPIADLSWRKYPADDVYAPLVRRNAEVEGTGHNSVVRAPNLVDQWIVYHGRAATQALDRAVEQRVMRIDQLFHDGDRLTTDAPTWEAQQAPAAPTVFDAFAGTQLDPAWTVVAGEVALHDDSLRTSRSGQTMAVHGRPFRYMTAEVHLRAQASDADARLGFVPIYHDDEHYVILLLDAATSTLQAIAVHGGISVVLAAAPLGGIDLATWHAMRVDRTFDLLEVRLDDVEMLTVQTGDDRRARIGLAAVGTAAWFSAVTATEHLDLSGSRLSLLPRMFRADRSAALTGGDPSAPLRSPLTLQAVRVRPGVVLTHEVEVTDTGGRVDLEPVHVAPGTFVRVELDATSYRVVLATDGRRELVGEGASDPRSSVRTWVARDGVTVRVGGCVHWLPIRVDAEFDHSVRLAGATLRSFELTTLAEQPLDGKRRE